MAGEYEKPRLTKNPELTQITFSSSWVGVPSIDGGNPGEQTFYPVEINHEQSDQEGSPQLIPEG